MRLEKQLYRAIDNHVPASIYRCSMTGAALHSNGMLDRYYDGARRDCWIEFKQLDAMPRSGKVSVLPLPGVKKQPRGKLSHQQLAWAQRRWKNGQNAFVVVGLPSRIALTLSIPDCEHEWGLEDFKPLKEVSEWIIDFVGAA